jgi:hypothetical protein
MTGYVADTHAHVQKLVSVVKMTTLFEVCTTEEQRCCVVFCGQRTRDVKDIHKEMFLVFVGKCLSRKAVHI